MDFLTTVLIDFGFKRFITSMVIKVIYLLIVLFTVLEYLVGLVVATNQYGAVGLFGWLIFGSLLTLIGLCVWRVMLECLIIFFRLYEDVHLILGKAEDVSSMATGMRVELP